MDIRDACWKRGKLVLHCTCTLVAATVLIAETASKILTHEEHDAPHYPEQEQSAPPASWSSLLVTTPTPGLDPAIDGALFGGSSDHAAMVAIWAHHEQAIYQAAAISSQQSANAALLGNFPG